jgi:hypothetical protein
MAKKKPVTIPCPICGKQYQVAEGVGQPTCGDPNCIRVARASGMPFATLRWQPHKAKPRVPKKGKNIQRSNVAT